MPRLLRRCLALALCVIAAGTSPGHADPMCEPDGMFRWCGDHVPVGTTLRFTYDPLGAPAGVPEVLPAAEAAMDQWRRFWPAATVAFPIELGGISNAGFKNDGLSVISWGSPSRCAGSHGLAVACVWYRGTSGTAAKEIIEVDIVLDPTRTWADHPDQSGQAVAGEFAGLTGFPSASWFDVRSVLVHELGHAIGLEDIGRGSFPKDLTAAGQHVQSMYGWIVPGSTHARSIEAGDIVGLERIAAAMALGV